MIYRAIYKRVQKVTNISFISFSLSPSVPATKAENYFFI